MNVPVHFLAAASSQPELVYVWEHARPEAKVIIFVLVVFSIMAWAVMASKAVQMRRGEEVKPRFNAELCPQNKVLALYYPRIQVDGFPLFFGYPGGSPGIASPV